MQDRITDFFPSEDLKEKIRKMKYTFSEEDVLHLILDYVKPLDIRVSMLYEYASKAEERLSKYALAYTEYYKSTLEEFCQKNDNCVYELAVRCNPDACEDTFLCSSYESVRKTIDLYYEKYADIGACESPKARYTVKKKRLFNDTDSKLINDELGEMILGEKKNIIDVSVSNIRFPGCSDNCLDCDSFCPHDKVTFPSFARGENDLVRYTDEIGRTHIGLSVENKYPKCALICIIPLDSDDVKMHAFDGYIKYEHVEPPYVTLASEEDLTEREREDLAALLGYMKKAETARKKEIKRRKLRRPQ